MSAEHVYRVVVTREDVAWLADVPELEGAHTYARTWSSRPAGTLR